MDNKRVICCDKIHLAKAKITDDGFIEGEAVLTRAGIFKYITADGTVSRRFRPPEEVTKKAHLDSMKMMPITERHPTERWVDSKNAKQHMVGQTGENVRVVSDRPIASIKILDHSAVEKVKSGELKELSLGYTAILDHTPGSFNGEQYDCVQRDMICNHLALVPHGRANAENQGEFAQINLCDSNDAILDSNVDDIFVDFNNVNGGTDMPNMVKITLDGIQYDAAPEVANALEKAKVATTEKQKQLDDAAVAYQKIKSDMEVLQGKHDVIADELKKAKAHNDSLDITSLVKARVKVLDSARDILTEKEAEKIEDMSDLEIKKTVVKAMLPNINLDGKNDLYIEACFDTCLDLQPDKEAIASQRLLAGAAGTKTVDENDARDRMIARMFNGGKDAKKEEK